MCSILEKEIYKFYPIWGDKTLPGLLPPPLGLGEKGLLYSKKNNK